MARRVGYNRPYIVDDGLETILSNDSFEWDTINDTITPIQLSTICQKFFKVNYSENKGVSLSDKETPVYRIFSGYLTQLDSGKLSVEYKPGPKCLKADRNNLTPNQIISYCCAVLKWYNRPYIVDDELETILSNDSFEGDTINDTITPTQLSTICQKFFKKKYNENTYVSLSDKETPVYRIFSEYLTQLDSGKLSVEYKPSPKCLKADRNNLNPNQIISYCCAVEVV